MGQFAIYKGMGNGDFGAFQFRYSAPRYTEPKNDQEKGEWSDGAVMVEAAPKSGDNQYDWSKKIVFKLGMNDVVQFLNAPTEGDPDAAWQTRGVGAVKLTHKYTPNGGSERTTTLNITPAKNQGTWWMTLNQSSDGESHKVNIPINQGEYEVLKRLLTVSVPDMLRWFER